MSSRHGLHDAFSFWCLQKKPNMQQEDYLRETKLLGSFDTVEGFWAVYSHIQRPTGLESLADFQLFRTSIKPFWEDAGNRRGGKWIVRVQKGISDRCWENLCLALISGKNFSGAVCGVVCSMKFHECVLSVWLADASDEKSKARARDVLKEVLDLGRANNALEFRQHDQSLRHATGRKASDDGSSPVLHATKSV